MRIEIWKAEGISLRAMARRLGRSPATVPSTGRGAPVKAALSLSVRYEFTLAFCIRKDTITA